MSLLNVENLSKSFGALQVLKKINIDLEENERHVIIGPNGAGKTTLFNCITGVLSINEGIVTINREDVTKLPSFKRVSSGMARTFQKNNLFENLTIEENMHLAITACKPYQRKIFKSLKEYDDLLEDSKQILMEWNLWERKGVPVKELSYGEQRLLEIMLALASKPKILLLDEPTSGMSPVETANTTKLIQKLPRSISILVIEHDMEVVFSIADRITVMHHGEIFLSGSPEEIHGNEKVKEIYFGGGALKHA